MIQLKTAVLLASFALTPCFLATATRAQEAPTAPIGFRKPDAQNWRWRVQPAVGKRYQLRLFTRAQISYPAPDAKAPQVIKTGYRQIAAPDAFQYSITTKATADFDAIGRDAQGATTFRVTFRSLDTSLAPAVKAPDVARNRKADAMFRQALIGKPYQIKFGSDGHFTNVAGYEAIDRAILRAINTNALSTGFDRFTPAFHQSLGTLLGFPTSIDPTRVGQTAPYAASLPGFSDLLAVLQGERTLESLENGVATVTTTAQATAPKEMPIPYDISGTVNTRAKIDMASGLPLEMDMDAQLRPALVDTDDEGNFVLVPLAHHLQVRLVLEPR